VNEIPRFVENDGYVEAFGWQWNRFPKTQLDSYTGLPISETRLKRCLGDDLWRNLAGSHVLECGCGAGRFTELLLKQGAFVTSVDLSSAVEANARNCPVGERHRIAKADILNLPFAPRQFDVVICIGVIQHTPNSEDTIARLYDQVRPGGWLIIDHYTQEKGRWSSIKPLVRAWLKRQSPDRTLAFVESAVDSWLPWHRRFRNFYPAWFALCRISPIVTYYRLTPELPEPLQREWAMLDTHDSLTDWYKHLRTESQIRTVLQRLGLQSIWCQPGGNGIEARGQRPG
jgi:SAM-dependent methyltransferase